MRTLNSYLEAKLFEDKIGDYLASICLNDEKILKEYTISDYLDSCYIGFNAGDTLVHNLKSGDDNIIWKLLPYDNVSRYTATDETYTGLLESSTFGVALSKSGYDVGKIDKKQDKMGNWVINIPLTYNPDDFDIDFSVEMDKSVPKELYPDAVIVKLACWDAATNQWVIISQQRTTETAVRPGARVDIDENTGKGSGSYPVWMYDANNNPYGYRAVVAGFIYDKSTVIVPSEKNHIKDENHFQTDHSADCRDDDSLQCHSRQQQES